MYMRFHTCVVAASSDYSFTVITSRADIAAAYLLTLTIGVRLCIVSMAFVMKMPG